MLRTAIKVRKPQEFLFFCSHPYPRVRQIAGSYYQRSLLVQMEDSTMKDAFIRAKIVEIQPQSGDTDRSNKEKEN